MSRPTQTLLSSLKRHLPRNKKLLIAVSGGLDSISLLHGSVELARQLKLTLAVAHVDHALRRASASDATFVRKLAKGYKLKCFVKRCKKPRGKENLEAWGREQRYNFFADTLKKQKFDFVVTAHSANDVAETFLMRLVSNKELTSILRLDRQRRCIRPLLDVTREEIVSYAKANKLAFRHDVTNDDTKFLRNKIRKKLLPFLSKEFDPRIVEVLALRAAAAAEDRAALAELCDAALIRVGRAAFGSKPWLAQVRIELKALPSAAAVRFAERLIYGKLRFNIGRAKALEFVSFIEGNAPQIEFPTGFRLRRKNGALTSNS